MIVNTIKTLTKDSIIYGLSQFIGRGIDFLMLPFLTRIFTPEDFGFLELLLSTIIFLNIIILMGTNTAFFFYYHKKPIDSNPMLQRRLFQGMILWNIVGGVLIFILLIGILHSTRSIYLHEIKGLALFSIIGYAMLRMLDERFLELFRILGKPFYFFLTRVSLSVLTAIAILALYNSDTQNVENYFQYLFIALLVIFTFDLFLAGNNVDFTSKGFRESIKHWPLLLKFGVIVFPGAIAMIIHNLSDRWMLEHYNFRFELGLYAIAAKFGAIMNLVVSIFTLSFQPISMKIIHDDDRHKISYTLDLLLRYYLLLFGIGSLTLTLLSPFLLNFIAPQIYSPSITAIPLLTFAAVMFGVTYFTSLGTWKKNKAIRFTFVLILSALINILLNIFIIPLHGMKGAAVSTAFSMTILVIFSFIISQSTYKLTFSSFRIFSMVFFQLFLSILLFLHFNSNQTSPWYLCGLGVFTMVILTMKLREINAVIQYIRERLLTLFLNF